MNYYLGVGLNAVDPAAYGGWEGQLTACHNDVLAVQQLLRQTLMQWEFAQLLDGAATIARVEAAYADLARRAQAGDLVVILHSHHGGRFRDKSGDEADGWDETLVLWDGQVVDDVHAAWLAKFAPGVRVLLLFDTCHSETIARGGVPDEDVGTLRRKAMPPAVAVRAGELQGKRIAEMKAGVQSARPPQAAILTLAACRDRQSAMDGDVNGEFTTAVLAAWRDGLFAGDHAKFLAAIRRKCPDQTPMLRGYGERRAVAAFRKQRPFTP